MGKSGFYSGYGKMQNLQAGIDSITAGASGSQSYSFDQAMKNAPAVNVTPLSDTNVWVSSRTTSGFTVNQGGSTAVNFSWIAMDDSEDF